MSFAFAIAISHVAKSRPSPPGGGGGPSYQSPTLFIGYYTLANHGAVPLDHPGTGVVDAITPSSWSLSRISGDATAWPEGPITSGLTPAPTRTLTVADYGTTAVYSISADGVPTGATLTLQVSQPGYTVSTKDDIDSNTTGLRQTGVKSQMGGRYVYFQRGSDEAWENASNGTTSGYGDICLVYGFNTHTAGTYIHWTSSDQDHKPAIGRFFIDADNSRHKIHGLKFEKALSAWPANGLAANDHSGDQSIAMLQCNRKTNVDDIEVYDCTFGAPDSITDPSQWVSGFNFAGDSADFISNVHVHDVTVSRVRVGAAFGNATNLTYENFTVHYFCGDAINGGASGFDNIILRNWETWHPIFNPVTPGIHPDHCQIGSSNSIMDIHDILVEKFICGIGLGDRIAQGPFFNDTGFHGTGTGNIVEYLGGTTYGNGAQKLTGYYANNCEIRNGLVLGSLSNGVSLDRGSGWIVRNVALLKLSGPNVDNVDEPVIRTVVLRDQVTHDPVTSLGEVFGNISFGAVTTTTGISAANNFTLTDPGDTYAAQIAYYENFFADPANNDWRPKAGQFAIDVGDVIYAGPYNPDGSWADASDYLSALTGTFTLPENAAADAVAGTLTNVTSGSTLSLTDNAGGRVALSGNNIVRGATALDYETATSHSFTVRETLSGATNSPRDTVLTLSVTNVGEEPASYLVSTGGYFVNTSNVPSGTTRLRFTGKVYLPSLPGSAYSIFSQESNGCDLDILSSGLLRVCVEDSAGTKVVNFVTLSSGPTLAINTWHDLVFDVDHTAQTATVTVNGGTPIVTNFGTAGTGTFQSSREVSFLAQSVGGQACPSGTRAADLAVEKNGAAYKTISNNAATANADSWQQGTDFTQGGSP